MINKDEYDSFDGYVDALEAKVEELTECLTEAVDLMEDIREGEYKPDSFTTQPWRAALKQEAKDE